MQRKIAATFTVELDQLERLTDIAARERINRSILVREGINWILKRYEQKAAKVEAGDEVRSGGAVEPALARRS